MRLGRSPYLITLLVVVCCMFIATPAVGQNSGTAEGWHYAGSRYLVPVCGVFVAVGVILLGWSWLRLAGAITSIAMFIKDNEQNTTSRRQNIFTYLKKTNVDELCKAINEHINNSTTHNAEYEKQIKDFQIQVQLSQKRKKMPRRSYTEFVML